MDKINLQKLNETADRALNEKWDKLESSSLFGDALFTDRFDDVIFKLKSIPSMGYKLLCDEKKGYYMLCEADQNNHDDMLIAAVEMGFYYPEMEMKYDIAGYQMDSQMGDNNLIYLVIKPDDKDPKDLSTDGYRKQYIYDKFVIYPRACKYEKSKFYDYYKDSLQVINKIQ